MTLLTTPTEAVHHALTRAGEDRAADEDRIVAFQQALDACATLNDVRHLYEALSNGPVHTLSAAIHFVMRRGGQGNPFRGRPNGLEQHVATYLQEQVSVLATAYDAHEARWRAGRMLDAAGNLGCWSYDDDLGRAIRTASIMLWDATKDTNPKPPVLAGGASAGAADSYQLHRDMRRAGYDLAAVLSRLSSLDRHALEDLVDGSATWAAGTEAFFVRHLMIRDQELLPLLCQRTTSPESVISALGGLVQIPVLSPENKQAIRELCRQQAGRTVGSVWSALVSQLFHHSSDTDAVAMGFELAAEFEPDLALRWLAKEPLYRLAPVPRAALELLMNNTRADIRQQALVHMDRLLRAEKRRPPASRTRAQTSRRPR